jgi:Uri superfamily endonuclease
MKGIYILIFRLGNDAVIQIGKLGELEFKKGSYAYAGSALGTGGFKRVARHFKVASGKKRVKKWHIDHLLPYSEVVCAVLHPTDVSLECTFAQALGKTLAIVPGFGCTDCICSSHLFFSKNDITNIVINVCNELTGTESIIIRPHV